MNVFVFVDLEFEIYIIAIFCAFGVSHIGIHFYLWSRQPIGDNAHLQTHAVKLSLGPTGISPSMGSLQLESDRTAAATNTTAKPSLIGKRLEIDFKSLDRTDHSDVQTNCTNCQDIMIEVLWTRPDSIRVLSL